MPLAPAAKLSLVEKKNIRDEWDSKRPEYEAEISKLLGTEWTINVDPLIIAPYVAASDSYAGRPGDVINGYFDGVASSLQYFLRDYPEGADELNRLVPSHQLALDVDHDNVYSYCGPLIKDGKLYIVFKEDRLWVNASDALDKDKLLEQLGKADAADAGPGAVRLSPAAKAAIGKDYTEAAANLQEEARTLLKNDKLVLNPNFEAVYAALEPVKKDKDPDNRLGNLSKVYFEEFVSALKYNKFDSDDLLQEAWEEVVTSNEVVLRIVDELTSDRKHGDSYAEAAVENGVLYLQTTPQRWGTNCGSTVSKLVDVISDAA
ncbi:uncharacterized protein LOC62_02G001829 [Vanrija pseudolonga]|uniref:Uncharacterized protein n=1 Tax=Vanrija pseudolonga TaxID=143232 RepID=A0AAF0Y563_9TREE|nr:hypothetical protein LOC62_02G001829 [Vanrija pseudolonga]